MSKEYIPRETAIDSVKAEMKYRNGTLDYNAGLLRATENLEILPAADVAEVRHGRWEEWWPGDCALIMTGEEMLWMCSECTAKFSGRSAYCPNCGAKMK